MRRPTRKTHRKDNYSLPQPATHIVRFPFLKDAHTKIPVYSLLTSSQLQWNPDGHFRLTNPTMMSTTDEQPVLPFPMCHPVALIGSNEKVVFGPAPGTATNENPNATVEFGLCCYCRFCFNNSLVHGVTKDECLTLPGQTCGLILHFNVPDPSGDLGCPIRSACYNCLGSPRLDVEGI